MRWIIDPGVSNARAAYKWSNRPAGSPGSRKPWRPFVSGSHNGQLDHELAEVAPPVTAARASDSVDL
jgi:hypothetical protein